MSGVDSHGFGEEFINEFVMYSYDVPLSKSFVPGYIRRVSEGFKCALFAGPWQEFAALGQHEKVRKHFALTSPQKYILNYCTL